MTHSDKAAERGEPSYVWRSGQERRLGMIRQWSALNGRILDDGCGLGSYLRAFAPYTPQTFGIEIELERAIASRPHAMGIAQGVGEFLPFPESTFDFIFSNEVIEHVSDDRLYAQEMVRVAKLGGRILIFCPNRWYPVEQHGIYWKGEYHFGNKPFVNYLPDVWRNQLAPHVRAYTTKGLLELFIDLPVRVVHHTRIFGGYDNIVRRSPQIGRIIQKMLYALEKSPINILGLSHLLVLEKQDGARR